MLKNNVEINALSQSDLVETLMEKGWNLWGSIGNIDHVVFGFDQWLEDYPDGEIITNE